MKQHKQRIQLKILITLKFISLHEKLLELSSRKKRQDLKLREFDIWECYPSKHFNVGSMLFLGWYDVATSHNVKSTLKQRCVRQRWNLQRWNNVVYFNVELNNVRQRRNNVVIFNVDFHNVGQRRNNVANTTIWKKLKPRFKNKIIFLNFKEYGGLKIFIFFPL